MSEQPAHRIHVVLPLHLARLAGTEREAWVDVPGEVTQRSVLDALEAAHPQLEGTIRDRTSGVRRPLVRFFACEADLSNEHPDAPLPAPVVQGVEPYLIVGAMAGG